MNCLLIGLDVHRSQHRTLSVLTSPSSLSPSSQLLCSTLSMECTVLPDYALPKGGQHGRISTKPQADQLKAAFVLTAFEQRPYVESKE